LCAFVCTHAPVCEGPQRARASFSPMQEKLAQVARQIRNGNPPFVACINAGLYPAQLKDMDARIRAAALVAGFSDLPAEPQAALNELVRHIRHASPEAFDLFVRTLAVETQSPATC
jgi:hypothetical protein